LENKLHVLCSSNDENREILGYAFDPEIGVWNSCDDVSEGKAASGVSATSYGNSAFLAFQENGPDDTSRVIYISEYKDGKWKPQEAVAGQTSADPPQLSILNGRINCIFNANDDQKNLKWYSRYLLDYSLGSWMKDIPDDTLLSNMTVPGTHDSCAESNIPFVRTQYLSISKQMEAGIRFLDLRCRVHSDGQLYMYHGGIPINMPMCLKFDKIMNKIFTFFSKNGKPTETVLISINNDDVSGKERPEVFYNAVKTHIDQAPRYEDGSERWITARTTVTLGEARGKAVLLRRYHPDPALSVEDRMGIDLSGWLNNNPDFTFNTPDGVTVTLQDKWQYSDIIPLAELIKSKFGFVSNMLEKSAASDAEHWFLNFMSAVGDPVQKGEIAESHWIAVGAHSDVVGKFVQGMNPTVRRMFSWDIKKRYGVIAMDYPELPKDSDLISWLIGTNM
jgi:1-phosphatidylinositol phosphodiesterase